MAIFNVSKDDLRFFAKKLPLAVSTAKVQNAVGWFQDKIKDLTTVTGETNSVARVKPGRIYAYRYDAKWKHVLPTFDKQPLTLILNVYNDGSFLGCNFHYLPPIARHRFMGALIKYGTGDLTSINDYIRVTYPMLQGIAAAKLWKPTIHKYLYSHVRTQFSLIHPQDYRVAIFLPTARWYKHKPYGREGSITGAAGRSGKFRA